MPLIHDAGYRSEVVQRIGALPRQAQRQWGKMSVDQMLWHVNNAMAAALGQVQVPAARPMLPHPLMRFVILNLPWPRGAPTAPAFVAHGTYDMEAERRRCVTLIEQVASKGMDEPWAVHPILGPMQGRDVSRLLAKHLHHHLRQFGA